MINTLGSLIGEIIHLRCLPTLSIDWLQTRNVIQVSEEDTKRLQDAEEKEAKGELSFQDVLDIRKEIERNYLPMSFECVFYTLTGIEESEELKKAINRYLWDTDLSHYIVKDGFLKKENEIISIVLSYAG